VLCNNVTTVLPVFFNWSQNDANHYGTAQKKLLFVRSGPKNGKIKGLLQWLQIASS
jgi:hypothetical protein